MSAPELLAPEEPAGRVIARNTLWRSVAFGARTASGLVVIVLVARQTGPLGLGQFQFAMTLTLLAGFLVQMGLQKLLVRELARKRDGVKTPLEAALFATTIAGTAFTVIVVLLSGAFGTDATMAMLLFLASAALTIDSLTRIELALVWAYEQMRYEAFVVGVQETVFLIGAVGALALGFGVVGVMTMYLVSRAAGAVAAWLVALRRFHERLIPRPHHGVIVPMLRRTLPFALDDALSYAYIRADAVLLGVLAGARAVGFYQAATNLVLYLNVLPRMLNMSLYPRMSRAWPKDPDQVALLRDGSLRILGIVSMPIMVGSFLLAERVFPLVYGSGFHEAVLCYLILVPVIPIRMLGNTLGTALTAVDRQTPRTVAVAIAAAANILINLLVIPRWGFLGAAGVTVATELGLFVAYAAMLRHVLGPSRLRSAVVVPGIACVPMAVAVLLTLDLFVAIPIVLGAAAYLGALYLVIAAMRPELRRRPRALAAAFVQG